MVSCSLILFLLTLIIELFIISSIMALHCQRHKSAAHSINAPRLIYEHTSLVITSPYTIYLAGFSLIG